LFDIPLEAGRLYSKIQYRRSAAIKKHARKRRSASLLNLPLNSDPNYEGLLFIHTKQNQHLNIYFYTSLKAEF